MAPTVYFEKLEVGRSELFISLLIQSLGRFVPNFFPLIILGSGH